MACGGSGSGSGGSAPPPPVTYTIGGTVTNLAGTGGGLVLQNNGRDSLTVSANGKFTFVTSISSGAAYTVTVLTQPSSPAQTCGVTQGTGTATSNVTSVAVDCAHNEWTWENGPNSGPEPPNYGTQGIAASTNIPGLRTGEISWSDANGNFWLFGGNGYDSTENPGYLNDLWKYSAGEWTWVGGSNLSNQKGIYGTQGTASPSNIPGAREGAFGCTDTAGDFWLFGGFGYDSTGYYSLLNDLWKFSAGQWMWVGGPNVADQIGSYGTQGKASPTNTPGARQVGVSWIDAAGNLWLFGGLGFDSMGNGGSLNDLWKYSAGEWAWMAGSNVADQIGVYGTRGTASANNTPGARYSAVGWIDASGSLWLFGGDAFNSTPPGELMNDLWKYGSGGWTWVGGSNLGGQNGIYGTQGMPAPDNVPGARVDALSWTDASGNFWLFGGIGVASANNGGDLNDLWKYSSGEWTWVNGANVASQPAIYGTLGTPAPGNDPGSRSAGVGWIDSAGNL